MSRLARIAAGTVEKVVLSARALMESAGLSYDALHSWRTGRREPTPESLTHLADAIEKHARTMEDLANDLRKQAKRAHLDRK